MAISPLAAGLTDAHRAAQSKRGAFMAYAIAALWLRTVRQNNVPGTSEQFLKLALALIRRERKKSIELTRAYYPAFRQLEIPDAPEFELPPAPELITEKVETSLRVTGPIAYQKKVQKAAELDMSPELERAFLIDAYQTAAETVAASAVRHTLDGGRDQMRHAAREDKKVVGWARVTRDDPCFFCAMLASRGPVYGEKVFTDSDSLFTGSGTAKVHDACQCTMEPAYSRDGDWPGRGRDFEALWEQATTRSAGGAREDMRSFRALIEGRPYEDKRRSR